MTSKTRKLLNKISAANGKSFYLLVELKDGGLEGIKLTLSDCVNSWTGELTEDELADLAANHKQDYSEYVDQTCDALTYSKPDYLYQYMTREATNGDVEFSWKKYIQADEIKLQLGNCILHIADDPIPLLREMVDFNVNRVNTLNSQISHLTKENSRLSTERSAVFLHLDECVSAKNNLEGKLFKKFVAVLNAKKEEICRLKRRLTKMERRLERINAEDPPDQPTTSKEVLPSKVEACDDSGSETDVDTRENQESDETDEDKDVRNTVSVSTAGQHAETSNVLDSPLLSLDDADVPLKRQKRQVRRPVEPAIVSKRVCLPKTSSLKSQSSSQSTRLPKRRSRRVVESPQDGSLTVPLESDLLDNM